MFEKKSYRFIPQKGVWFEVVLVVCCIMPLISWLDCFFKQSLAKEPSYQSLLELSALVPLELMFRTGRVTLQNLCSISKNSLAGKETRHES